MGKLGETAVYRIQDILQIAYKRSVRTHIFINFRRIDIYVQYFGVGGKFFNISHHTVGETGPQCNQEITFTDSEVRCLGTVHAYHTRI